MKPTRLQETILYILQSAQQAGVPPLSRFQLMKLIYLIQIESMRFAGIPFIDGLHFYRQRNGPLSAQVYNAVSDMEGEYVKVIEVQNKKYGHNKHEHRLIKTPKKYSLSNSEIIFLNSVLKDYLALAQKHLKEIVYETEPMVDIVTKEQQKRISLEGLPINMSLVPLDQELIQAMAGQ